ncbi:Major facilitator superfamily domain, general substrate transporter [Penicillium occitanis (nom. inval.)]|nr:Major facilitator superfamily domain, general substrate transporter [Penicillium occitanis (nom. inval.)]
MVSLGQNLVTIFLGRFLSGLFGNAPISIVGGAATDNWNAIDRGISLGVVIGAVFSGPMMGPIIGGFVAENLDWRWNLWLMIIAGFAMALICALFLEESYIPRALVKKAKRIRKETGNDKLRTELEEAGIDLNRIVSVYLVRPWMFVTIYQSFIYGIVYLFFTSIPIEFKQIRQWDPQLAQLPLCAMLIGVSIGSAINVVYTKRILARQLKQTGSSLIPEQRLPLMIVGGFLFPAGLFWFAWTSDPNVPWPAMVVAGIPTGVGMFLIWIQCFTYLIDVYLPIANSAIAINSLSRSLFGAGFPLFTPAMYDRLGYAWATSLLAFLGVAMIPVPIVFYLYGQRIRSWSKFAVKAE